ncbi:hypothetical protein BD310DRAFT_934478 [Dichomitus squalens]|uniref:Uncharacterized protein n=1 Tax=Dichomitus squalens TaxID=114155 RepID=A0A4Q9PLN4_9APHY|nr:hypothetical protein BD310DRAFT_934478 [Dichomitus squalens]
MINGSVEQGKSKGKAIRRQVQTRRELCKLLWADRSQGRMVGKGVLGCCRQGDQERQHFEVRSSSYTRRRGSLGSRHAEVT